MQDLRAQGWEGHHLRGRVVAGPEQPGRAEVGRAQPGGRRGWRPGTVAGDCAINATSSSNNSIIFAGNTPISSHEYARIISNINFSFTHIIAGQSDLNTI